MRAVVHDRYGPPACYDSRRSSAPSRDDEVLVRVHASTVNRTDCHIRGAKPFLWRLLGAGFLRPKQRLSGSDLAGEVAAVGSAVSGFAVGDHVFGTSGYRFGAHAEFVCVSESARIAHKPAALSFEEAASIADGALAALSTLKHVNLREGQKLVVYGASGAMGTAAVQLGKFFGAHVTAVCNTKNVELVQVPRGRQGGRLHAGGLHQERRDLRRRARRGPEAFVQTVERLAETRGVYVATDLGFMWHVPLVALASRWIGDRKLVFSLVPATKDDLLLVKELIEAGRYRAVIDRRYPLEQVVEAARYVETGQKTGNVVLTVNGDDA